MEKPEKQYNLFFTDVEMWELAQFIKRLTWSHIRDCAVDNENAEQMKHAILKLEKQINESGFAPR